jgi:hypothetical protein
MLAAVAKVIIALLILLAAAIVIIELTKKKRPVPRPGAVIVEDTRGALNSFAEWFSAFLATTPHVNDDRCAEARALMARIESLLNEYASNPEKDQDVYNNLSTEYNALKARVEQWCS